MAILVTGGAGYIGSHTVLTLLERGDDVVVIDNLANASQISLDRVAELTGREPIVYIADVLDRQALKHFFTNHNITDVIHFLQGLKSVSESIKEPFAYYENNVTGTLVLLDEMLAAGVNRFIFSSSATVYGNPESVPLSEQSRTGGTTNPYGTSKLMVEHILADFSVHNPISALPACAISTRLALIHRVALVKILTVSQTTSVPYISRSRIGKLKTVSVYGNDYPTPTVPACVIIFTSWIWRLVI